VQADKIRENRKVKLEQTPAERLTPRQNTPVTSKENRHLGRADQTRDESQGHQNRPTRRPTSQVTNRPKEQTKTDLGRFLSHPPTTADCRSREPHLPCTSLNLIPPEIIPYRTATHPPEGRRINLSRAGLNPARKKKATMAFLTLDSCVWLLLLKPRQRELAELCPILDCLPCYLQAGEERICNYVKGRDSLTRRA
jgi:hypothetical protein